MSDGDSLADLAEDWIALHRASGRDKAPYEWAFDRIDELLHRNPDAAWQVIDLIWRRDQSELILANLAAGPVEDLLVRHGPGFIDRICTLARREPVFRKLLGAVWRNRIDEAVWRQLRAIAGPPF